MSRQRKASVSETLQANALRRAVTRVRANSIAKQSLSKAVLPSALIQLPQTLTENHHDFTTLDVKLEQRLVKESPERLNRTPLMNVRHLNRFLKILIMHYKAILLNDSANIHKLLESDENKINDTDSLECNALHYALLVDSIETFKHLLAKGANLNQKDSVNTFTR